MNVSVVISTYNRAAVLDKALKALSNQQTKRMYEVIVVDNNSTDATKSVVERFLALQPYFRYVFEERQGLSYGRNAGIHAARADLIAFTDDDVEAAPNWIECIVEASLKYPNADFLGGRVLPARSIRFPGWAHGRMAPFALQDYGGSPIKVDASRPTCLIGACLITRRRALNKAGLFSIETQRIKDGYGSMEDATWEEQIWRYGGHGMYVPEIVVYSDIAQERMEKSYHRQWCIKHGEYVARSEQSKGRQLFGVPVYVYRHMLEHAYKAIASSLRHNWPEAFEHECTALHNVGFMKERLRRTPVKKSSAS